LRKFSHEVNEDEINDFVDLLSLQLVHIKTEFSAANFFSIDMALFFTIISACTTYLVILIQFKNYEEDSVDVVPFGNGSIIANLSGY
jgi:7tm Chemosensory receptor